MPILNNGTGLSVQASFNNGTLDINGLDFPLATLSDVTVTAQFSTKELRGIGSIKMATAPKRSTFKPSAKAKIKSLNKEVFSLFGGYSTPDGSGWSYGIVDGQNALSRVTITCYVDDAQTKTVQYQFINAILSGSFSAALKTEDFAEVDIEIEAQDLIQVTSF